VTQTLSFNSGIAHKRLTKRVPEKYLDSVLRPNVEQGDGIRPSQVYIPHRSLKVKFQDRSTDQYVVIPKGRIVSALQVKNSAGSVDTGGVDFEGNAVSIDQDQSYFGVSRNTAGLIVPANGGTATTYTYTASDVSAGVPDAAVDGTYQVAANAPIGVVFKDVFQDIRGQSLNYDTFKNYGILTQQHLAIPFVDSELASQYADLAVDLFHPIGFTHSETGSVTSIAPAVDAAAVTAGVQSVAQGDGSTDITLGAGHGLEVSDTFYMTGVTGTGAALYNGVELTVTHLVSTTGVTVAVDQTDEVFSSATWWPSGASQIVMADHGLSASDTVTLSGVTGTGAASFNTALTVASVVDENTITVAVDYIDEVGSAATYSSGAASAATGAGYAAAEAYFSFLTLDSTLAGHTAPGALLRADRFGNFMPQYSTLSSNYQTVQTVGRILGLDNRFPKDLLETVEARRFDSSALARPAGNLTEGLSEHLFWFAYRMLDGAGYSWPTDGTDPAKKVIEMVQAGAFGMAHIQLNIK
jgi:hypothetical protein